MKKLLSIILISLTLFIGVRAYAATCGKTTIGASNTGVNDEIEGSWCELIEAGEVSKLTAYISTATADNKNYIAAMYEWDADNDAGVLVGTTQVALGNQVAAWVDFPFASPLSVEAGKYFLVLYAENTSGSELFYYDAEAAKGIVLGRTYDGAFPNPMTGETGQDREFSIYATYTAAAPAATSPGVMEISGVLEIGNGVLEITD